VEAGIMNFNSSGNKTPVRVSRAAIEAFEKSHGLPGIGEIAIRRGYLVVADEVNHGTR